MASSYGRQSSVGASRCRYLAGLCIMCLSVGVTVRVSGQPHVSKFLA